MKSTNTKVDVIIGVVAMKREDTLMKGGTIPMKQTTVKYKSVNIWRQIIM